MDMRQVEASMHKSIRKLCMEEMRFQFSFESLQEGWISQVGRQRVLDSQMYVAKKTGRSKHAQINQKALRGRDAFSV